MELNCPSLDYVYSMTWAEFQIRAFAYNRIEERKDLRTREIAWNALIGSHYDPKKLPKRKDLFWSIGDKKQQHTEGIKEAMDKAREQYFKQLKEQQNGK